MAICGIVALVLGFLAGLRFRVMIVLPLELAAAVVLVGAAAVGSMGVGEAGLGFLVYSVALQLGYAVALTCRSPVRLPAGQRGPLKA